MKQVSESSQQDRRVYVGNLSYDIKWHHLKNHLRKIIGIGNGTTSPPIKLVIQHRPRR